MVGFAHGESFLRSCRDQHLVATMSQDRRTELAELRIILDQQDRLGPALHVSGAGIGARRLRGLVDAGKINLEGRAAVRFAVDPDVTSTLFRSEEHTSELQSLR